jgi:hypothetical protein
MNRSGRSVLFWSGIAILVVLGSLQKVEARPSSPGDGIKVHGHWTIDVHNPDGKLASHNEFENACVQCGQALGIILSRQYGFTWRVFLQGTPAPCAYNGSPIDCSLLEVGSPVFPDFANNVFATLGLSANTAGGTFTLNGSFVATFDGQISSAESITTINGGAANFNFSQRTLGTPIQVAAGQTVYVTVTFSFS